VAAEIRSGTRSASIALSFLQTNAPRPLADLAGFFLPFAFRFGVQSVSNLKAKHAGNLKFKKQTASPQTILVF